jgi:hypothetical protein
MEVLDQSGVAASVKISETEARLLSMAVDYYKSSMGSDSPLVAGLSERLKEISDEFNEVIARGER